MTINTLDDLFEGGTFCFIYSKNSSKRESFSLDTYKVNWSSSYPTILHWIIANGNHVLEWWIELAPKVIEEVNKEFDLSK